MGFNSAFKGLTQVKLHLDSITSETKKDLYKLSDKITTKNYVAQALEALGTLRWNLDVLLDNILKAKKGILQPKFVPPSLPCTP